MKTFGLVISILYFSPGLQAQVSSPPVGDIPVSMASGGGQYGAMFANLMGKKGGNYQSMLGTPYLFDDWAPATVAYNGELFTFDKVKVDVMTNVLEILTESSQEQVLDQQYFKYFYLQSPVDGKNIQFVNAANYSYKGKKLPGGFMKFVQVGEANILRLYKARIQKPSQNAKIVGMDTRDKIVIDEKVYVALEGQLFLIENKKDLLEIFPKKKHKAEHYLKENKVKIDRDEDLVGFLVHCQK